jgi:hypothetical protein
MHIILEGEVGVDWGTAAGHTAATHSRTHSSEKLGKHRSLARGVIDNWHSTDVGTPALPLCVCVCMSIHNEGTSNWHSTDVETPPLPLGVCVCMSIHTEGASQSHAPISVRVPFSLTLLPGSFGLLRGEGTGARLLGGCGVVRRHETHGDASCDTDAVGHAVGRPVQVDIRFASTESDVLRFGYLTQCPCVMLCDLTTCYSFKDDFFQHF